MAQDKILIVENEPGVAKQIETWLTNLNYTVSAITATGPETIRVVAESSPDLILMGIKLTDDMDGITTAQHIREKYRIPIIYLTAYSDDETLQRAKATEPAGYLTKPFAPKELHTTIQTALYNHQMEKKLRESEERYRSLFDGIPIGLYRTTPDGEIVDANMAMVEMMGYPNREALLAVNVMDTLVDPQARQQWQDRLTKENIVRSFETQIRCYDESIIWVEDSAQIIRDDHGQVRYYEGSLKDITERKEAENALLASTQTSEDNIQELKIAYQQAIIYAQELTGEITERRRAERQIRRLNEELEQRVSDRTRDLSVLYLISMVTSDFLDLETMLSRSLDQVLATIQRDIGAIHLIDEAQGALHLASQYGIPDDALKDIQTVPLNHELVTWIIDNKEALLIPDASKDTRLNSIVSYFSRPYTFLSLPMRAGGQVLGILTILGDETQQFNAEEVALLASVADQVGVAIENARLRQQAENAAIIEERERLARELHDSVTQSLYSLGLFAEAGENLIDNNDLEEAKHNLRRMGETALQALKEMRLLVYQLRPLDLEKEGLIGALHQRLSAVEGRVNIKARLVADELVDLPAPLEEELYRIAQEALNNALKHAAATAVTIHLGIQNNEVELEVVDDGQGFDPLAAVHTGGMGLQSMQARAEKLGGTLSITSGAGEGTSIKVTVKVKQRR